MESSLVEFVNESDVRERVLEVFRGLRGVLEALLPGADIEHVGSTSVPGSVTKGNLDICVIVEPGVFEDADRLLGERFDRNIGSDKTESLSSFVDGSWTVPVGIQLVGRGGEEDFFVRWRELLRGSPRLLHAYNAMKGRWNGRSHDQYRIEKARFIEQVLRSK